MSFDTVEENRAFAEKFKFPFRLLSDTTRAMGLAFGACDDAGARHARRLTYVIGPAGLVEQAMDTKDPAGQATALLASLP